MQSDLECECGKFKKFSDLYCASCKLEVESFFQSIQEEEQYYQDKAEQDRILQELSDNNDYWSNRNGG